MPFQIIFYKINDIHRVASGHQNTFIEVKNRKGQTKTSPTLNSLHPQFSPPWRMIAQQEDYLTFTLKSLKDETFNKGLCFGLLDISRFQHQSQGQKQNKQIYHNLIMDSSYSNYAELCLSLLKKEYRTDCFELKKDEKGRSQIRNKEKISSKTQQNDVAFFKGACNSRNFFSFLDSKVKGQFFNFIEDSYKR